MFDAIKDYYQTLVSKKRPVADGICVQTWIVLDH